MFGALALLILIAGAIKLWFALTDPFADIIAGFPIPILLAGAIVELVLGIMVLLAVKSYRLAAAKFLLLGSFGSFALIGVIRTGLGYESCGCFGPLTLPVWPVAIFDAIVVGCLTTAATGWRGPRTIIFGPARIELQEHINVLHPAWAGTVLGVLAFIGVLAIDPSGAPQFLFGASSISGERTTIDGLRVGATVDVPLNLKNQTAYPATVIGATRSCGCILIDVRAVKILPGESKTIHAHVTPKNIGRFHQRVLVFVDHPKQHRVVLDIFGFAK
jgi:hypothetical protein